MLSSRQAQGGSVGCWPSSAGQGKGHETGRGAAAEKIPRGSGTPTWRGCADREERRGSGAPTQWPVARGVWLLPGQRARQAWVTAGVPSCCPGEADVASDKGRRGRWGRAVLHGVRGWGCESRGGGPGPGDRAEKTVAAGPRHKRLGLGHSWSRHAATAGRATGAWQSLPGLSAPRPGPAGLALYTYS